MHLGVRTYHSETSRERRMVFQRDVVLQRGSFPSKTLLTCDSIIPDDIQGYIFGILNFNFQCFLTVCPLLESINLVSFTWFPEV